MSGFKKSHLCTVALAALGVTLAAPQALALTVGDFREAYATAHILDDMPVAQRGAYIAAHHAELDLARVRLESAELIVDALLDMNALQMQAARPPFVCNYDLEDPDFELDKWVDEFRAEAPARFKVAPGPKTDALLDQVPFDDVVIHKIMEKYPCPVPKAEHAAKHAHAAKKAAAAPAKPETVAEKR
jgi:hypothetical protein